MNLAGYLFRHLREAGIEVAFGGAEAFLWEAAEAAGLRTIPLPGAGPALDAAAAYRRAAGRPAVVLGSGDDLAEVRGPAGVLAVVAAPGAAGRAAGGSTVRFDDPGQAAGLVREALAATGRAGGLMVVAVAEDRADLPAEGASSPGAGDWEGIDPPDAEAVETAGLLLSLAARPVIWAGGGAVAGRAWDELAEVADLLGAPVVTSVSGKGAVSDAHPLALGSVFDAPDVARLTGGADAGLAVGTRFSARSTRRGRLPMPMQLFQVDVDTTGVGRQYPARLGISGDARAVLGAIAGSLRSHGRSAESAGAGEAARQVSALRESVRGAFRPEGSPQGRVLDALRAAIPAGVATVWDAGPARWAVPLFPVPVPGTFHAPAAGATPGSSLAAALGVAAAGRGPAVAVLGTAELVRRSHDLAALAAASLPVVPVVFDGPVWSGAPRGGAPGEASPRLRSPDPAALGSVFGLPAVTVADLAELPGALGGALESSGPTLIAVGEGAPR